MSEPDPLGLVGLTIDELRFDEIVDTEGEGLVYRGKLANREGPVAIKCLSLSRLGASDPQMRAKIAARFSEETKILRRLANGTPDIVQCIADGRLAAPTNGETVQYQVLEWLDGRSLRLDFNERQSRGMPGRSLRETMDMVESAALAIAHAHTQGIVHRDLQPTKMMLVRARNGMHLKVLDFGLAKTLGRDSPIGADLATFSPQYCAPEQISGGPQHEIGPWSDVWALAMVVLEMLRGQAIDHPQAGNIHTSEIGISVPQPVEDLLVRATSLDPQKRPPDAGAFWREMRDAYAQTTGGKPPASAADALAATALDADAAAAILRIRAMTAGTPQSDKGTMLMAASPPHPTPPVPIQEGPLAGTKPIAIPSPLASSIGGNVKSSVMQKGTVPMTAIKPITPMPGPIGSGQKQQHQHAAASNQIPIPAPAPKSHAMVIAILVGVIVLVLIVALALALR